MPLPDPFARRAARILTALLAGLTFLTSCGDDDGTGPDDDEVVSAEIGPAGGVLESADGQARARIPAGALAGERTLTVERLDEVPQPLRGFEVVSEVYRFGPDGQTFALPVRVEIVFDDEELPSGVGIEDLTIVKAEPTGEVVELADIETFTPSRGGPTLQAARGIGGLISAFSPFAVVVDETPGTPPAIVRLDFPESVPNSPGSSGIGTVDFADAEGDVTRLVVEAVSDPNDIVPDSLVYDLDVAGQTDGTFSFDISCLSSTPCGTGDVTFRAILVDAAGNRSEPVEFEVSFVVAGAGAARGAWNRRA